MSRLPKLKVNSQISNVNSQSGLNKQTITSNKAILIKKTFESSSNMAQVNTKPVPIRSNIRPGTSRNPILRRSRSTADVCVLSTLNKPMISRTQTVADLIKKPIKRPGAPMPTTTLGKINKIVSKENVANLKNQVPKPAAKPAPRPAPRPAPYDFKAKYNLLKEQHDKLKSAHIDLKEKYAECNDQNEILLESNEKQKFELDSTKDQLTTALTELNILKEEANTLRIQNDSISNELNILKPQYKAVTEIFEKVNTDYLLAKTELNDKSDQLVSANNEIKLLKNIMHDFETEKRSLHNLVQELKGNIRVFCRIRPALPAEDHRLVCNLNFVDEKSFEISKITESVDLKNRLRNTKSDFSFDKVFGPQTTQEDIFLELSQLVQSALDGYNVCVFAYGQTGSGKTYTMEGGTLDADVGMIPRTIDSIFELIESLNQLGWIYTVKASFLEIYNENIVDLLEPKAGQHEIRMVDAKCSDIYVTNLSVLTISNAQELKYYLSIAQRNRAVASTRNNERSSRSHSVAKILLEGCNEERKMKLNGTLNLIDLAGSEKVHAIERLKETQNINKSLANLTNVIMALVQKQDHVPYRNSKLTHLLMPCLGGNSKTLMLVNISPLEDCYNESLNSLRFAQNVNQCKTGSIRRNKTTNS